MNRAQMGWGVALVLSVSALGCTSSEPQSELAAACFDGVELEAWELRFSDYCASEIDDDMDGDIDARTVRTFDEEGRLLSWLDAEGWGHRVERDDRGRVVLEEQLAADRAPTWRSSTTYEEGSSRTETDVDADGVVDAVTIRDYTCFEGADEPPGYCVSSTDEDLDGELDRVVTNEWNEDGTLASMLIMFGESEVQRITYFYDDGREWIGMETDDGDDGTIDSEQGTERLSDRVTRQWHDFDGDGVREGWIDTELDSEGNPVTQTQYDGDGSVLYRVEVARTDDRRVARIASTSPAQPERDFVTEERYDQSGNLVASATDQYPFGSPDQCVYYSYACWSER